MKNRNLVLMMLSMILCVVVLLCLCACLGDWAECQHSNTEWIIDKYATCTESGSKHSECTTCHETLRTEVIDARGHDLTTTTITVPTCTAEGTKRETCSRCSYDKIITLSKLTHSYVDYVCTACGDVYIEKATGLEYTLNADGNYYIVTGMGTETRTRFIIPSTYKNLPVKEIGEEAFGYDYDGKFSNLSEVVLSEGITTVSQSAFLGCINLLSVTLPGTLTSIEQDAFNSCLKLVEIINKSSLNLTLGSEDNGYIACYAKAIYTGEFVSKVSTDKDGYQIYVDGQSRVLVGYTGTQSMCNLPDGITEINAAFAFNENIKFLNIPDSVTNIGERAFYNCTSLKSVIIPDSVTNIGEEAFSWCHSLTNITIENGVTSIGDQAFYNCTSLKSVIIPDSVTNIGEGTFCWCPSLTNITIGNGVTSIGDHAFCNCTSLKSVIIPDSVVYIGALAFESCSNLISATIGKSVIYIGEWAFGACRQLALVFNNSSLKLNEGSEDYGAVAYYAKVYTENDINQLTIDKSGYLIHIDGEDKILIGYTGTDTDLVLPFGITEIRKYAFQDKENIVSVAIPDSVTNIGERAFYGCTSLTSVTIGNGVTRISCEAFYSCTSLTSVIFKNTTTWYCTSRYYDWINNSDGYEVNVTNTSRNATYFKATYSDYYWYRI